MNLHSHRGRSLRRRSIRVTGLILTCVLVGLATTAGVDDAQARSCSGFSYRPPGWFLTKVFGIRATRVSCKRAGRLIRQGQPAASSYDWIPGWRCRAASSAPRSGYRCTRGARRIRFKYSYPNGTDLSGHRPQAPPFAAARARTAAAR